MILHEIQQPSKHFVVYIPSLKKLHLKEKNLQPITSDVNNIKDDCNVFEMYEWLSTLNSSFSLHLLIFTTFCGRRIQKYIY